MDVFHVSMTLARHLVDCLVAKLLCFDIAIISACLNYRTSRYVSLLDSAFSQYGFYLSMLKETKSCRL